MEADKSAVGAINRPLRLVRVQICDCPFLRSVENLKRGLLQVTVIMGYNGVRDMFCYQREEHDEHPDDQSNQR